MRWASVASMENTAGARPEAQDREFDVVVLGATGVAGRLIAQQLVDLETGADGAGTARWAIAGRDPQRLQDLAQRLSRPLLPIVPADTTDPASLRALVRRTRVLLSAAGPYLPTAEAVIGACVEAGTSYLDLSGEIPLLRRVDDRFDSAARDAGVSIVQMAGWEALPADVVCLVAAHRALGGQSPATGAGGDIETVDVGVRFPRLPAGGVALKDAISGGTMGSLATQLRDRDARLIRDPASLLPPTGDRPAVHARSPLRLLPHIQAGRVMAPAVPVAFLNPPAVHRTAALLAAAAGTAHRPARFREGIDVGPATGTGGALRRVGAAPAAALQRLLLTAALLPRPPPTGDRLDRHPGRPLRVRTDGSRPHGLVVGGKRRCGHRGRRARPSRPARHRAPGLHRDGDHDRRRRSAPRPRPGRDPDGVHHARARLRCPGRRGPAGPRPAAR